MSTTAWVILLIANIPVCWLFGWVVFREWDEFWECLCFWFTPNILSAFRGELFDDMWGEMRLGFWVVLCGVAIFGEYHLLMKYLLHNGGG